MDISKVRRFWTEMVFDETNKLMGQPVSWLLTMDMHVLTEGNQWDLFFYLSYIKISVTCLEEFEV